MIGYNIQSIRMLSSLRDDERTTERENCDSLHVNLFTTSLAWLRFRFGLILGGFAHGYISPVDFFHRGRCFQRCGEEKKGSASSSSARAIFRIYSSHRRDQLQVLQGLPPFQHPNPHPCHCHCHPPPPNLRLSHPLHLLQHPCQEGRSLSV